VLRAELSVEPMHALRPEEVRAYGRLVNDGEQSVDVDPGPLSSPSLALELADGSGKVLPLPPPPVPGASEPAIALGPGEEHRVDFPAFVPAWFEPGAYRARLRYVSGTAAPVVSDWVEFSLG
jgi:hypothetical protein